MDFMQNNHNYNQIQQPFFQPQPIQAPIAPRPQPIGGRVLQSISDFVPNDVRGDGTFSFFPVCDENAIYAMRWAQDGSRIERYRYVLDQPDRDQNAKSPDQIILERLDSLEVLIRGKQHFNQNFNKNKGVNQNGNKQNTTISNESIDSKQS